MNRLIIYDSDHPGALQNRCFSKDYALQGTGHSFTVQLAEKARARGFDIVTGDVFLAKGFSDGIAFCITDMHSSRTNLLLRKGAVPMICLSTESPIIARDFYMNIRRLAGRFIHNIQFRGAAERLKNTGTLFSVMYYPVDRRIPLPYSGWHEKKLLVLVNRNKRMFRSSFTSLGDSIRTILSIMKVGVQKMIDPWVRSKEIYKDRIKAIYHFSNNDGFHLYGQGWENRIPGFSARYHRAARRAFQGSIRTDEKLKVMNHYKFSLCFENCQFPGYVTEKIFDCFLAGCIPIYYGAPDIDDFVPQEAFIDYRDFKNLNDLEQYLINMSETEAIKKLDAAKHFLAAKEFDKYFQDNIIDGILDRIDNYDLNLNLAIKNDFP